MLELILKQEINNNKEYFQDFTKMQVQKNLRPYDQFSIYRQIYKNFQQDKMNEAQDTKEVFKIEDAKYLLLLARSYIQAGRYADLQKLMDKENTKKEQKIPFDIVANLLLQKDQKDLAYGYINKIADVEYRYFIFLRQDQQKLAVQSIIAANQQVTHANDIRSQIKDPEALLLLEQSLQPAKKK